MAIETWLPAVLGYLVPFGLFLLSWGAVPPSRARRAASMGAAAVASAALGYFAVGFAFHLGGANVLAPGFPGLEGMRYPWGLGAEWGLIGTTGFFLTGGAQTPEAMALFVLYLPLVAASVMLLVLSVGGTARGWQVTIGGLLMGAVLFPIVACWSWGGGWLAQLGSPNSIGAGHGFTDHAGSGTVYLLSGVAALGALVGLGYRLPRSRPEEPEEMPPAHFPLLATLGALLFGLGWLGWSSSVPFHAAGAALSPPRIIVNGLLAGAGSVLASQLYCWITVGQADPLMSARGAAVGFIAVSAGAPFFRPWSALATGLLAGALLPLGVYVVDRLMRLPDDTAAVSMGLVGGLIGLLAVPLFADGRWGQGWNGVGLDEYRNVLGLGVVGAFPASSFGATAGDGPGQLIAQLTGAGAIIVIGFLAGLLLFLLMQVPFYWGRRRMSRPTQTGDPAPVHHTEEEDTADFVPLELLASHEPQPHGPESVTTDAPSALTGES